MSNWPPCPTCHAVADQFRVPVWEDIEDAGDSSDGGMSILYENDNGDLFRDADLSKPVDESDADRPAPLMILDGEYVDPSMSGDGEPATGKP